VFGHPEVEIWKRREKAEGGQRREKETRLSTSEETVKKSVP